MTGYSMAHAEERQGANRAGVDLMHVPMLFTMVLA